ncbi:MAG: histidine phosphatase family protein [Cyanobacteriota bacterium]|nr:histidine phosphatase family protein [Cyanobacteriota bacterium]
MTKDNLTLYFLRHGDTESSRTGTYCGTLDLGLTSEGMQMAEDFAAAYQSVPWQAVYASPMTRVKMTAKPLCDRIALSMQVREGLKEIAYGKWEGKSPQEVYDEDRDAYLRWLNDPGWNAPTGGEKGIEIARRSALVLEEIEQMYPTGNVLVVSHKATIRIMLCELLGIDVGRFRDRIGMLVGSVSVVEMASHGPLLKILGDRSHLRESLRNLPGS